MTCVAFSIKFAKTNQKFAENSELIFVKIIHYYSKLFTGVLSRRAQVNGAWEAVDLRCEDLSTCVSIVADRRQTKELAAARWHTCLIFFN